MGSNITAMDQGTVLDMLSSIDRGSLVLDLEEEVKAAVQAACETGKKAAVAVVLSFDPDAKTGAMRVSGALKTTLPKKQNRASLFFPNGDGSLSRTDPRQREMFVDNDREVLSA